MNHRGSPGASAETVDRDVSTIVIETLAAVGVKITIGRPVQPREAVFNTLEMLGVDRITEKPLDQLAYPEPQAAAIVGVPVSTLREARKNGEIGARKIGRSYQYTREELLRWIQPQHGAKTNGKPWGGR